MALVAEQAKQVPYITEDKSEGISAFKARRPAQFKGC